MISIIDVYGPPATHNQNSYLVFISSISLYKLALAYGILPSPPWHPPPNTNREIPRAQQRPLQGPYILLELHDRVVLFALSISCLPIPSTSPTNHIVHPEPAPVVV